MKRNNNIDHPKYSFPTFSYTQKRGIFVLVSCIVVLLGANILLPFLKKESKPQDFSEFEKQIASYEAELIKNKAENQNRYFNYSDVNRSFAENKLNPFPFDPNQMTSQRWTQLGLSEKQIRTIENFKSKGGKFRKKEDFRKMYCISAKEYEILAPYIQIEQISFQNPTGQNSIAVEKYEKKKFTLDLNEADTLDFQELRGIGPAYSSRIVKYRNRLGGFYSKNQLLEVFGFTPEMLSKIESSITLNPENINHINLNIISLNELKKHPYLDYYQAKAIVQYREKNGKYKSVNDLLLVNLMTEEVFLKLKPYLIVE